MGSVAACPPTTVSISGIPTEIFTRALETRLEASIVESSNERTRLLWLSRTLSAVRIGETGNSRPSMLWEKRDANRSRPSDAGRRFVEQPQGEA